MRQILNNSFEVVRFDFSYCNIWNDFVANSKNGTFLFHRDFMEYHSDRFEDYSLLVFNNKKLIAILPANRSQATIYSHQGLSYGGLILPKKISFNNVLECFKAIVKYLSQLGITNCIIKQVPKMYHLKPSDEMDYILFIVNAKLIRRDMASVIKLNSKSNYSTLRKRQIKKAIANKLKLVEENDFAGFWNDVLIPNLNLKFGINPVHSILEITNLRTKFPNHIKQYNVYLKNELLAGCTVFETETVAHVQYISTKKEQDFGALDFLIDKLVTEIYNQKVYFDFGISNENNGNKVNNGLLNWKEGFGSSSIVHDFYEIQVQEYPHLNSVML